MLKLLSLLKTALPIGRFTVYLVLALIIAGLVIYFQHRLSSSYEQMLRDRDAELQVQEKKIQRLLLVDRNRSIYVAQLNKKKKVASKTISDLDNIPEAKEWKNEKLPDSVISSINFIHSSLREQPSTSN